MKWFSPFISSLFFFFLLFFSASPILAAPDPSCSSIMGSSFSFSGSFPNPGYMATDYTSQNLPITISGLDPDQSYTLGCFIDNGILSHTQFYTTNFNANGSGQATWQVDNLCFGTTGNAYVRIVKNTGSGSGTACTAKEYTIEQQGAGLSCSVTITDTAGLSGCFAVGDQISWQVNFTDDAGNPFDGQAQITIDGVVGGQVGSQRVYTVTNGAVSGTDTISNNTGNPLSLRAVQPGNPGNTYCTYSTPAQVSLDCTEAERESPPAAEANFDLCNQIPQTPELQDQYEECVSCEDTNEGIWTAVGCIKWEPQTIVRQILRVALSIAGGVALLMILAAGFLFSTSQGDPKRVSEARELISSAVIGLLFIIFSVTILQFIGVSILQIPGFGG